MREKRSFEEDKVIHFEHPVVSELDGFPTESSSCDGYTTVDGVVFTLGYNLLQLVAVNIVATSIRL
jgi:hypothetical protein